MTSSTHNLLAGWFMYIMSLPFMILVLAGHLDTSTRVIMLVIQIMYVAASMFFFYQSVRSLLKGGY